jgi:isoleucyl-tRNA synthetase
MKEVLDIVVMGRAARNNAALKNRQPLATMFVKAKNELSDFYLEIIEDELNIKEVKFVEDMSEFSSYSFKPQLKTVGPKYGKFLGKIRTILTELDGNKAKAELDENGALKFDIDGNEIVLTEEDLLIELKQKENYCSLSDRYTTVALDTNLTAELIEEGYVNEIISKLQTMRKDSGFNVTDHITVSVCGNEKIVSYVKENEAKIAKVVLGDKFVYDTNVKHTKTWDINGEKVELGVETI